MNACPPGWLTFSIVLRERRDWGHQRRRGQLLRRPAALSCGAGPFGGIANGVLLNDGNTENAYWSVAVVCVLIQEGQLGAVPRGSRPSRAISRSLGLASRGTGTGAANWPPGPGPVTTSGMMSSRLVARAARRARAG